jgi:phage terminase large subunit-like protein
MNNIVYDLNLALDPVKFAIQLGFNPDPWQVNVLSSVSKRLMLNCSRQSGKSTTASILALHRAIYFPDNLILLISPSLRQSSELFRKVGVQLDRLKMKPKLLENNKLSCIFDNKSRIVSLPSSEGTIRGYSGANLIIEDEASRVEDGLYMAIRPMLAVSNGRLILMSTPFGKRGHFYQEWSEGEEWEKIQIKADDCPRISKEFLESERRSLGEWWFKQEYMCEFMDSVDSAFRTEEIRRMFEEEIELWEL